MLMKHPIKKNEIYQKLKKAIDDGIHPGGSFLPNETALAQIMGISTRYFEGENVFVQSQL